ncbi:hypothetical protein ASG04_06160 [Curtobacterium sp. Leaf183]|nr:hypothetical protein ASG04_06160 [Curtobacterium sp. Leaf183]
MTLIHPASELDQPIRLFRGAAVSRDDWHALDRLERRRLLVHARHATLHVAAIVSHGSAAALWGLPDLDTDDGRLHVVDLRATKTHSGPGVVRHRAVLRADEVTSLDGIPVTSLVRTVVDVIRTVSFAHAVVVLDHVLHHRRCGRNELLGVLEQHAGQRGTTTAERALRFADAGAESPGESLSRVTAAQLGVPVPVLQQPFDTDAGRFRVDFWWPAHGVVGEFDGRVKYDDPRDLWREKLREDAIRRLPEVTGVARWTMRHACEPALLAPVLLAAGLPVTRAVRRR